MFLKNKNILVTGVGKGLGKNMVESFVNQVHLCMVSLGVDPILISLKILKILKFIWEMSEI